MAAKKFIIVAGQDNALEVGDAPSWEDLHPYVALRNPGHNARTQAPQTSGTVYELPYTFPGGEQLNRYGDGSFGTWQDAHLGGRTVPAVRFLTHYNPSAAYTNVGTGSASQYPGTCAVVASPDPTSTTFATDLRWQYDPEGIVLTRHSTATTHTIAANASWAAGSTVTVSPPLVPPPVVGELFDYQIVGGAGSISDDELILSQQFGGFQDAGSTLDTAATMPVAETGKHIVMTAGETGQPLRFTLRGRSVVPGQVVSFSVAPTTCTFASYAAATITVSAVTGTWRVDDSVVFSGASLPNNVTAGTVYYIVQILDALRFKVSTTRGGTAINMASGGGSGTVGGSHFISAAFNPAVTSGQTYYVTRRNDGANRSQTLNALSWSNGNTYAVYAPSHGLYDGEGVVFDGDLPDGLVAGRTYYAEVTAANQFGIRGYPNGPPVGKSTTGGDATFVRVNPDCEFYISATRGGAEINAASFSDNDSGNRPISSQIRCTIQESYRGSLSGATITCTSGANVGESRTLGDIYFGSSDEGYEDTMVIVCDSAWDETPAAGDIYTIQPPSSLDWSKWAMFLPWSPYEGRAPMTGPVAVTFSAASLGGAIVATVEGQQPDVGTAVKFSTLGTLPRGLHPGVTYYVHEQVGTDSFQLKASYSDTEAITLL